MNDNEEQTKNNEQPVETKPCKACKEPINKKVKKCPHCGKKQKWPLWIKLLVIFLLIGQLGRLGLLPDNTPLAKAYESKVCSTYENAFRNIFDQSSNIDFLAGLNAIDEKQVDRYVKKAASTQCSCNIKAIKSTLSLEEREELTDIINSDKIDQYKASDKTRVALKKCDISTADAVQPILDGILEEAESRLK
jgi:hypothetical protein